MDHNLLPQVKNPTRIKIYIVIRSGKKMYLSTESTILPPGTKTFNIKGVFSFYNLRQRILSSKIPLPQVKHHLGIVSNYQVSVFAVVTFLITLRVYRCACAYACMPIRRLVHAYYPTFNPPLLYVRAWDTQHLHTHIHTLTCRQM